MIVVVKEYSPKTGKGTAVGQDGKEIKFTYKQLKNETMIPVGEIAELVDNVLVTTGKLKALWFKIVRLFLKWRK